MSPYIALILMSLGLALATGIPAGTIVEGFEAGVGGALGYIALIVGLPVFFEVGFVLLVPIILVVTRRLGQHPLRLGLPMAAGLSVVHAMVPPHPAAMLAAQAYHADIGLTVLLAALIGIPTAAIAGPLYARLIVPALGPTMPTGIARAGAPAGSLPPFGMTMATLLLPVLLMLIGSLSASGPMAAFPMGPFLQFIGSPVVALLTAVLASYWTLGLACGLTLETIQRFTNKCLAPMAMITLVVGVGAGFGRVLTDIGASAAIVALAGQWHISMLVLVWLIAALIRTATGSASVAMATAAGIVAPIAAASTVRPELLVIATGAAR